MNQQQGIEGHRARLAKLTDEHIGNLAHHARAKTPMIEIENMHKTFLIGCKC